MSCFDAATKERHRHGLTFPRSEPGEEAGGGRDALPIQTLSKNQQDASASTAAPLKSGRAEERRALTRSGRLPASLAEVDGVRRVDRPLHLGEEDIRIDPSHTGEFGDGGVISRGLGDRPQPRYSTMAVDNVTESSFHGVQRPALGRLVGV